eukprot:g11653.t1
MHEDAHFLPQADAQSLQSAKGLVAEQLLPVKPDAQAQVPVSVDLDEPFFVIEDARPSFMPVRADPTDPYSLASTYKDWRFFGRAASGDDLGFASEPNRAEAPQSTAQGVPSSSMYYLGKSDERAAAEQAQEPSVPEVKDPLAQMRERLEAQRNAGAPKYQVMRDDVTAPGATPTPDAGQVPSSSSTATLPIPPEKDCRELTDLQGRLWTVCHRGEHLAVYVCIRSPNLRRRQIRLELRCERLCAPELLVSDVALRFPSAAHVQEADASGRMLVVGSSEAAEAQSLPIQLRFPATTFLAPQPITGKDTISDYVSSKSDLLGHQTAQALSFEKTADLSSLVGRCAGLCHFHGIQQADMKFLLVGAVQPPSAATLEGQRAAPTGALVICRCAALVRPSGLELRITVKAFQQDVADEICSQLVNTFRELMEGRLSSP